MADSGADNELDWRVFRYLAPNLITALSFVFGMLALAACYDERPVDAAWFIIYAVLTDRLDGFVARLVRGTSELGVQLDSLADFLNFGLCPAVLAYTSIGVLPELPFASGTGRMVLMIACAVWILGATFRLARFNVTSDQPATDASKKIFFGVPTTLAAGLLMVWFLALTKYAGPTDPMAPAQAFGGTKLFGDITTPAGLWRYFPLALIVGGLLMASNLRMPKLGLARSRLATIFIFSNVFLGYIFGFARLFPEYLVWPPTMWIVTFLIWGALSREARNMRPPALFPRRDPAPGEEPIRPEDDLLPHGEEGGLDEGDPPAAAPQASNSKSG